jgi:aryl-alcohol dehydrogenase-like predicted oxidoreductase
MPSVKIGPYTSSNVAFGAMNVVHVYQPQPDEETAARLLNEALDEGYTMMDSAALYGFGRSEKLIAKAIMHRRSEFTLATKGVLTIGPDGKKFMDGHPDSIRQQCHDSLQRLGTDHVDLYYLHRYDKRYPLEDMVGAVARLIEEGKVGALGLSEMSADTLRKAHQVHPVAAMQTEYSLWTRNAELGVLETTKELGAAFVAFSPTARKFLTGKLQEPWNLPAGDLRHTMPRFNEENYPKNMMLLQGFLALAEEAGVSPAELSIAWVLAQGENIIALPGTTSFEHMRENANAGRVQVDADILRRAGDIINQQTVHGPRYNPTAQADIDTEEF